MSGMNEAGRWHGDQECPECRIRRMVAGEPRCRPCALDARDRFFVRYAENVKVVRDYPIEGGLAP